MGVSVPSLHIESTDSMISIMVEVSQACGVGGGGDSQVPHPLYETLRIYFFSHIHYRSKNYGASFDKINSTIGSPLWTDFHASPTTNLVT